MHLTIEQFGQQLKEYDLKCGGNGEGSILDYLWFCYCNEKTVDDGWILEAEAAISPVFDELSVASSDMLSDLVSSLVTAYQRAAFLEGIQVGFHLSRELSAQ